MRRLVKAALMSVIRPRKDITLIPYMQLLEFSVIFPKNQHFSSFNPKGGLNNQVVFILHPKIPGKAAHHHLKVPFEDRLWPKLTWILEAFENKYQHSHVPNTMNAADHKNKLVSSAYWRGETSALSFPSSSHWRDRALPSHVNIGEGISQDRE